MRTLRVVASAVILLVAFPSTQGNAQTSAELQGVITFAPNAIRTLTFSRQGVALATFEVPSDNWLHVSYDDSRADNTLPAHLLDGRAGGRGGGSNRVRILDHTARFSLHGNVTARVVIAQNLISGAPKMPVEPSPAVSITAQDVDVLITGRD
jgi:hypothetical protein